MASRSNVESGQQLFKRLNSRESLNGINPVLFPNGGPKLNQVIEITGDLRIDKSDILIDFIVKSVLPSKYNKQWKNSSVVLINTEFQINILKVIKVIEIHLLENNVKQSKRTLIEDALKAIIIMNCYSLEEVELAFYRLEKLLLNNEHINLVVVDNIAANYWIAKLNNNMLSYYQHSLKQFELLQDVLKGLNVTLLYVRNENKEAKNIPRKVDYQIRIQQDTDNKFNASVVDSDDTVSYVTIEKNNNTLHFYPTAQTT